MRVKAHPTTHENCGTLLESGPHMALAVVPVRTGLQTRPAGMSQHGSGEAVLTGPCLLFSEQFLETLPLAGQNQPQDADRLILRPPAVSMPCRLSHASSGALQHMEGCSAIYWYP
jgi:hypothetical protein